MTRSLLLGSTGVFLLLTITKIRLHLCQLNINNDFIHTMHMQRFVIIIIQLKTNLNNDPQPYTHLIQYRTEDLHKTKSMCGCHLRILSSSSFFSIYISIRCIQFVLIKQMCFIFSQNKSFSTSL